MLRQAGYTLIEKWECEFKKDKATDANLQAFLQDLELVSPLNPRDAFYGGRTGAVTHHCQVQEPDLIKYADATSLHPWVNKYKEYPVRFPLSTQIQTTKISIIILAWLSLIFCLPNACYTLCYYRAGGKLNFPLCAACVKEEQTKPWLERTNLCTHTD